MGNAVSASESEELLSNLNRIYNIETINQHNLMNLTPLRNLNQPYVQTPQNTTAEVGNFQSNNNGNTNSVSATNQGNYVSSVGEATSRKVSFKEPLEPESLSSKSSKQKSQSESQKNSSETTSIVPFRASRFANLHPLGPLVTACCPYAPPKVNPNKPQQSTKHLLSKTLSRSNSASRNQEPSSPNLPGVDYSAASGNLFNTTKSGSHNLNNNSNTPVNTSVITSTYSVIPPTLHPDSNYDLSYTNSPLAYNNFPHFLPDVAQIVVNTPQIGQNNPFFSSNNNHPVSSVAAGPGPFVHFDDIFANFSTILSNTSRDSFATNYSSNNSAASVSSAANFESVETENSSLCSCEDCDLFDHGEVEQHQQNEQSCLLLPNSVNTNNAIGGVNNVDGGHSTTPCGDMFCTECCGGNGINVTAENENLFAFDLMNFLLDVTSRSASSDQWWELWDSNTQRYYYFNTFTRQTVWHRPTSPPADIIPLAKIQALQLANQNNNTSSSNNNNNSTNIAATSNNADTSKTDPNLSHNGPKGSTQFHNQQQQQQQFHQPPPQTALNKVTSSSNAKCATNESAINDGTNVPLSSLISNVQQNCKHDSASSSHHAGNLAQSSCSKPNCHKQMSSTSTASKSTCHRHNHSRHRHDNHHGTHKHRHRNNHAHVNQATNVGTGDSVASFAAGMQTNDSNDSLIAAANNIQPSSGNNSGSINRTNSRQRNSGLSRASSEHRRHHGRSARSSNSGQRTLGHNQSSAAANVNPNQYEIFPGAVGGVKAPMGTAGVNSGRFLRSGCFGCNLQNAKGCAHDCNNPVPPVPARGQESPTVASGTAGTTSAHTQSRRSSHNHHHHHRCNKHRKHHHHPQHSHHTQTHTAATANQQMDEATREIINRSLQANNMNNNNTMTQNLCGHGVSGSTGTSSAVNHQAVQNQSCLRHLPQQPSVEQDALSSHQHHSSSHYNHQHQHHLQQQQQQIASRQQQQCHHDSTLKATTGVNNTPPISRKAPPPLPRSQPPPPPPLPHQHSVDSGAAMMSSTNAGNINQEVSKPQNVVAAENRAMAGGGAKARAQMPLPVPLDNSGTVSNNQIIPSTTSPPFSNYAINGSTPSPISGHNSLGKTKNKSPSAQTKDKQHMFHLSEPNSDNIPQHEFGSPNPFQTTTHVNVPNQRTGALSRNNSSGHSFKSGCQQHQKNSQFLAANSVHIEPSNSFTFNQNPMLDNQVNQKKVGMTHHANKVALSGNGDNNPIRSAFDRNQQLLRRSATPHLDPMTYLPSAHQRNQDQRHFHHNPNVGAFHISSSTSSNTKCQPVPPLPPSLSDCNHAKNLSCFQLTNNTNTNNQHINLSSDNLIRSKNDILASNDDFPLVDEQSRDLVNENALNRNQQLPFRYCKSFTDLISDPNFNSEADLETQKYTEDYENLKNPASISTDALYENTNNALESCQSCGSNRNSRNPFRLSDCCQRYSQGSQNLIGGSNDALDAHQGSRIDDQFMFNQSNIGSNFAANHQVEVYETLSTYTSSMLYENTRNQFQAPKIVQKDVKSSTNRQEEVDLIGRIYDQVASDEEERNLMENLENLSVDNDDEDSDNDGQNDDIIDRDLMFDDDEFESYNNRGYNKDEDNDEYHLGGENDYNENESELLTAEDGSNLVVGSLESGLPDYINTTMSSDTRESVYSVGAKFTPPSSRDILAAVDSKLGRKWAQSRSSNSPARPPKSSNLEMSPAIAGAANVGSSAVNQQASTSANCGVGVSNDANNKRASVYSQDSLVTSPTKTTNATFSSKESMLSTPSDSSEQSRSIQFTGQFSAASSSDHHHHHHLHQSNIYQDSNFDHHKYHHHHHHPNNPSNSKEENLLYRIETETEIECSEDRGNANSREADFGSWSSSGGNGERGNGQHIYDQPHVEQEYLLYEPAHEYDDPYVSDSLTRQLGRSGNVIYENSSLTSDETTNFLAGLALTTTEIQQQQSPVLSKEKGIKHPASQGHALPEPNKTALSSHLSADDSPLSSRVATASAATAGNVESTPLNLTRRAGLFKKKQSTSDVMKWTKDVIREPIIADKRYKKEAIECFKLIQQYMGDRKVTTHQSNYQHNTGSVGTNSNATNNRAQSEEDAQINCALELASRGWENAHLRDELILQVCKQSIDNSKQSSVKQGWELLAIFLTFFAPCEQRIVNYLENFLNDFTRDEEEGEEEGTNSGSGGGIGGSQSDELSFHLPNDEILPPGISSTLEKLCSIPVKKYALHCGKQLNRVVMKSGGVQDSCKMRRPTLEEIMAARSGLHQQGLFGSCLCDLMEAQKDSDLKHIKELEIPWVLKALIGQIVSAKGHLQEGILRVSGDSDLSQKLKVELNSYAACNPPEGDKFWLSYDTHVLAGVLKQWLRQLDEPVIPMELYSQCISCVSNNDVIGVVKLVNSHQMYEPNRTVLKYLIAFLQIIVDESESNKMTSRNIALVIAPNCLWSESRDPQTLLQNSQCEMAVIQALIENMSDTECLKRQLMQNFDI